MLNKQNAKFQPLKKVKIWRFADIPSESPKSIKILKFWRGWFSVFPLCLSCFPPDFFLREKSRKRKFQEWKIILSYHYM